MKRLLFFGVLMLFAFTSTVSSSTYQKMEQNLVSRIVRGKVVLPNGSPAAGVTVCERNTSNCTTTDSEGRYELAVGNSNVVLVYTLIGYVTAQRSVPNTPSPVDTDEVILEEVP